MSSKVTIKANELTDASINFVSLVNKGANRIPFRLMKADGAETMFDLTGLGRRLFKSAVVAPAVLAVIVNKTADVTGIKEIISGAGMSVADITEDADFIIFKQADGKEEGSTVLKMTDDIAVVLSGVEKSFSSYDTESLTFGEVMATEGFFPSICMAMDMLRLTIGNAMYSAETPADAKDVIEKAVSDFGAYITTVAGSVPVHAFKADAILLKSASMPAKGKAKGKGPNDADEDMDGSKPGETATEEAKKEKMKAKKEDEAPADAAAPEVSAEAAAEDKPAVEEEAAAPAKEAVAKTPEPVEPVKDDATDKFAAIMEAMAAMTATLTQKSDELGSQISAVSDRLGAAEKRLVKTEEAVNGTVNVEPEGETSKTVKSEQRPALALIDTAIMKVR